MELYSQILDHGGLAFGTILRHIRDRPDNTFIFHCTGASHVRLTLFRLLITVLLQPARTGRVY